MVVGGAVVDVSVVDEVVVGGGVNVTVAGTCSIRKYISCLFVTCLTIRVGEQSEIMTFFLIVRSDNRFWQCLPILIPFVMGVGAHIIPYPFANVCSPLAPSVLPSTSHFPISSRLLSVQPLLIWALQLHIFAPSAVGFMNILMHSVDAIVNVVVLPVAPSR